MGCSSMAAPPPASVMRAGDLSLRRLCPTAPCPLTAANACENTRCSCVHDADCAKQSSFGTGDTIGCGFDCCSRDVFFTRNGTRLPALATLMNFQEAAALRAFPTVSLSSPHDTVLFHTAGNFK